MEILGQMSLTLNTDYHMLNAEMIGNQCFAKFCSKDVLFRNDIISNYPEIICSNNTAI